MDVVVVRELSVLPRFSPGFAGVSDPDDSFSSSYASIHAGVVSTDLDLDLDLDFSMISLAFLLGLPVSEGGEFILGI